MRDTIVDAAANSDAAIATASDAFGQRYVLDFEMQGPRSTGNIRTAWIVLTGEDFPRLTTCHVV